MRGGTSKGLFILENDLPSDPQQRNQLLLRIMGSPAPYKKQVDGLGGATSSTSKVIIVGLSQEKECHISYAYGQVLIDEPKIEYVGICGNLLSAAANFAIYTNLLQLGDGEHTIGIELKNVNKRVLVNIFIKNGKPVEHGDYQIAGVPFTARKIPLTFIQPGGNSQGQLFPTAHPCEQLIVQGKHYSMTLLDGVMPLVLLRADDFALDINRSADELNQDPQLLAIIELIRKRCVEYLNYPASNKGVPKVALLFKPQDYKSSAGQIITSDKIDLLAKLSSVGKFHHAVPVSVMVMLAVAAQQTDTLLQEYFTPHLDVKNSSIRVGHNAGISTVVFKQGKKLEVTINRSARLLMQGIAFA